MPRSQPFPSASGNDRDRQREPTAARVNQRGRSGHRHLDPDVEHPADQRGNGDGADSGDRLDYETDDDGAIEFDYGPLSFETDGGDIELSDGGVEWNDDEGDLDVSGDVTLEWENGDDDFEFADGTVAIDYDGEEIEYRSTDVHIEWTDGDGGEDEFEATKA